MLAKSKTGRRAPFRSKPHQRSGVAAVEFAICLPMLLALVFGMIEASNAVYLQRSLTVAAYEAGSVAAAIGGTTSNAQTRANAVLTCLGVNSAAITVSPAVDSSTATGTTIVVRCSAPLKSNTSTNWCLGNPTFTATFTINHL